MDSRSQLWGRRAGASALRGKRSNKIRIGLAPLLVMVTMAELVIGIPALAQQTFTVDRLTDTGEGEGLTGDLRYCITNAVDGDVITFDVIGTINLTRALPDLTRSISIEGPGANLLTVRRSTGGNYRIFTVISGTVRTSGLTIANGADTSGQGGGGVRIYNSGNLIASASTISGNSAYCIPDDGEIGGGGIHNSGTVTINDSTILGNSFASVAGHCGGGALGGGVFNDRQGTLTISNSTISGNSANTDWCPKGVCLGTGYGGGVYNHGTLTISNSTISGNGASFRGGGIGEEGAFLFLRNTILAGNNAEDARDFLGRLSSSGYNLIGDTRGGSGFDETDLLNVNPLLGPLQDNGGPTLTRALLPGSPAIDAGDPDFQGPPDFDQRGEGFPRIVNGIIDIGAFEVQADSGARRR